MHALHRRLRGEIFFDLEHEIMSCGQKKQVSSGSATALTTLDARTPQV